MSVNLAYVSSLFHTLWEAEKDLAKEVTLLDVRGDFWMDAGSGRAFCDRVHTQLTMGNAFMGKQTIALLYGGLLCLLNKFAKEGRLFSLNSMDKKRYKVVSAIPYVRPFGSSEVCNSSMFRIGVIYEYGGGLVFGRYSAYTGLDLQHLMYVA